ncbi:MAG: hypothetical protein PVJ67_01680 [Candidatus Pacearchaeota archaeon]|jgi:hypothetical protein
MKKGARINLLFLMIILLIFLINAEINISSQDSINIKNNLEDLGFNVAKIYPNELAVNLLYDGRILILYFWEDSFEEVIFNKDGFDYGFYFNEKMNIKSFSDPSMNKGELIKRLDLVTKFLDFIDKNALEEYKSSLDYIKFKIDNIDSKVLYSNLSREYKQGESKDSYIGYDGKKTYFEKKQISLVIDIKKETILEQDQNYNMDTPQEEIDKYKERKAKYLVGYLKYNVVFF